MFQVYLSGEIHSQWRQQIQALCAHLDIQFTSANTDHDSSDAAGDGLAKTDSDHWRDHQSAKVNAIRIQTLIRRCDFAVIRFGDKYKQWNAAFDAGFCAALNKPYLTLHDATLTHPLKEVNASAMGWATTPEQVAEVLAYVVTQGGPIYP